MSEAEELRETYQRFIEHQQKGYEITASMIGYAIQKMQSQGIIREDVKVSGRIKGFFSAKCNSEKKALDDCFGIRIVAEEEDFKKILVELNKVLKVDKIKDHRKRKETKYTGIHTMVHLRDEIIEKLNMSSVYFPEIEIQYWTPQLEKQCTEGDLAHVKYKQDNLNELWENFLKNKQNFLKGLPKLFKIKGTKLEEKTNDEVLREEYGFLLVENRSCNIEDNMER